MTTTLQSAQTRMDPRFRYTAEHQRQYEERGYCIFDYFLSADGVAECNREIARMLTRLQPGRGSDEIISAHHQERWIFELACEPAILDMIERQIGPDIILWSSALVAKPPRTGREIPWHQDAPYWGIKGTLAGGVWIPFDDITVENGAMSILPGWHRRGVLPRRKSDQELFNQEIEPGELPPDLDQLKVSYIVKAGQAAIHDTMIPHNSVPNHSDQYRRVLVLRYASADSELPSKTYSDYRTGEPFPREGFLIRGRDMAGRGWRRQP